MGGGRIDPQVGKNVQAGKKFNKDFSNIQSRQNILGISQSFRRYSKSSSSGETNSVYQRKWFALKIVYCTIESLADITTVLSQLVHENTFIDCVHRESLCSSMKYIVLPSSIDVLVGAESTFHPSCSFRVSGLKSDQT